MTSRDLKVETAEALLQAIKREAEKANSTTKVLELAQAYAAVADTAPRASVSPRSAAIG